MIPPSEVVPDSMPERMKTALFYQPGDVRYEDAAVPVIGPKELLVQVDTALTCGTDLKCFRRGHPVLLKSLPSPFGHEFAGTVVRIGAGVSRFETGDRVVCANSAPCYDCYYCHKGQYNLCEHLDLLNGAYAEYIRIPAQIASYNTYRLPDHLPFETAAFTEPLSVCLRAIELSDIFPGDRVAVIGLGAIGQLLVRLAKWKGAHVSAMARNPMKLRMAESFGYADALIDLSTGEDAQVIRQKYTEKERGFDKVIEAVGLPQTWELAIDCVRRGGTVNLFGGCESGTQISLDTRRLHYDEIRLISSFHHTPQHVKKALELLSTGVIDPSPLITDTLSLAELNQAFERMMSGQAFKFAIRMPS